MIYQILGCVAVIAVFLLMKMYLMKQSYMNKRNVYSDPEETAKEMIPRLKKSGNLMKYRDLNQVSQLVYFSFGEFMKVISFLNLRL